jgi:hypothetical protein
VFLEFVRLKGVHCPFILYAFVPPASFSSQWRNFTVVKVCCRAQKNPKYEFKVAIKEDITMLRANLFNQLLVSIMCSANPNQV